MKKPLAPKPVQNFDSIDSKELDFFLGRLAEVLLAQVEEQNENEYEKTRRIHQAV